MKRAISHIHSSTLGPAIKCALLVPLLLLSLLNIIEFGRFVYTWWAIHNAAYFAMRYAVTGQYDPEYCAVAVVALGLEAADTYDGDPADDCQVPDSYDDQEPPPPFGQQAIDLTAALEDWARLPAINDQGRIGLSDVLIDPGVSGDYLSFLNTHNLDFLGNPSAAQYYHITICSNRDADADGLADFRIDKTTNPSLCYDTDGFYMDDAGSQVGRGSRVRVVVSYVHPVLLPLLNVVVAKIPLSTFSEGLVEQFDPSRIGVDVRIEDKPTDTPISTNVPTNTVIRRTDEQPVANSATRGLPPLPASVEMSLGYTVELTGGLTEAGRQQLEAGETGYFIIAYSTNLAVPADGIETVSSVDMGVFYAIVDPAALTTLQDMVANGKVRYAGPLPPEAKLTSDLAEEINSLAPDDRVKVYVTFFETPNDQQRAELTRWLTIEGEAIDMSFISGNVEKQHLPDLLSVPVVMTVRKVLKPQLMP